MLWLSSTSHIMHIVQEYFLWYRIFSQLFSVRIVPRCVARSCSRGLVCRLSSSPAALQLVKQRWPVEIKTFTCSSRNIIIVNSWISFTNHHRWHHKTFCKVFAAKEPNFLKNYILHKICCFKDVVLNTRTISIKYLF